MLTILKIGILTVNFRIKRCLRSDFLQKKEEIEVLLKEILNVDVAFEEKV